MSKEETIKFLREIYKKGECEIRSNKKVLCNIDHKAMVELLDYIDEKYHNLSDCYDMLYVLGCVLEEEYFIKIRDIVTKNIVSNLSYEEQEKSIKLIDLLINQIMKKDKERELVKIFLYVYKNKIELSKEGIDCIINDINNMVTTKARNFLDDILEDGYTLLTKAVKADCYSIVDYITTKGVDINKGNQAGVTPFIMACLNGNFEIVKYLIDKEVNIEKKDKYNMTPLVAACRGGNLEIVKYLIDKKVNKRNIVVSLMAAIRNNNLEIAKYLIDEVTDVENTDLEIVRSFLKDADKESKKMNITREYFNNYEGEKAVEQVTKKQKVIGRRL